MATMNNMDAAKHYKAKAFYSITPNARKVGLAVIEKRIEELGLVVPTEESGRTVIKGSNKRTHELGTDSTETVTIDRYQVFWRGLLDFCIELGDIDSAIILARDLCPENPWSVAPEHRHGHLILALSSLRGG